MRNRGNINGEVHLNMQQNWTIYGQNFANADMIGAKPAVIHSNDAGRAALQLTIQKRYLKGNMNVAFCCSIRI